MAPLSHILTVSSSHVCTRFETKKSSNNTVLNFSLSRRSKSHVFVSTKVHFCARRPATSLYPRKSLIRQRRSVRVLSSGEEANELKTQDSHVQDEGNEGKAEILGEVVVPQFVPPEGAQLWEWRKKTIWRLVKFILPAITMYLADSLMSLVDTLCIGQFGSTLELAALGPNTVLFNFSSYIFFAVGLATNTLVGQSLRDDSHAEASRVVSQALMFSAVAGLVIFTVFQSLGPQLIAATGAASETIPPAISYLRIRCLSAPAVVATMAAQAGLLAQQNSKGPSLAVLTSAGLNIALDIALIRFAGWGITGAAIATVLSQYLCLAVLLNNYIQEDAKVKLVNVLPTQEHIKQFLGSMGPIFIFIAAKNVTYLLIQSSATAMPSFLLVAAHQAVWSIWAVGAFICSPMEHVALAFLPQAKSDFESGELVRMLLGGGLVLGVAGGLMCSLVPQFRPDLFTPDTRLWGAMQSVAWPAFLSMLCAGLDCAINGILLSEGEVSYLARAMIINLTITAAYFYTRGRSGAILDVWWGLLLFFFMRVTQGLARVIFLAQQRQKQQLSVVV